MGDMNARFGNAACELPGRLGLDQCSYLDIPDQVQPSDNANALPCVCIEEELVVVNNLRVCSYGKTYTSNVTYRQGRMWTCTVSPSLVKHLCDFDVN